MRELARALCCWVRTWGRWDWAWLGWIAAGLALDIRAARDARRGNTLSEGWWWVAGIGERRHRWVRPVRIALLAATAWAVAHLWSRRV